ncbi:MAG: DUF3105 domain-containing protein [Dehalococcoidia bacterium]
MIQRDKAATRTSRVHGRSPSRPPVGKRGAAWRAKFGPLQALAVATVVVAVSSYLLVLGYRQLFPPLPGTAYASQGNEHINPGDSHPTYNSNPATSGWHYPNPPRRGTYAAPLPEETLVHFMEHAGVVIHYRPDTLPADQLTQLTALVNRELDRGVGQVLLAPDPTIPTPVALTAWQRLESFDGVIGHTAAITDFIERLECHYDPEGICGPPHGTRISASGAPLKDIPMR